MKTSQQNDYLENDNQYFINALNVLVRQKLSLTNQHDGNFLPRWQQLEPEALRYRDEAVLIIRVEAVAFLRILKPSIHKDLNNRCYL